MHLTAQRRFALHLAAALRCRGAGGPAAAASGGIPLRGGWLARALAVRLAAAYQQQQAAAYGSGPPRSAAAAQPQPQQPQQARQWAPRQSSYAVPEQQPPQQQLYPQQQQQQQQQQWQPDPGPPQQAYPPQQQQQQQTRQLVFFEADCVNTVSLTGVVAAAPTTQQYAGGRRSTSVWLSTYNSISAPPTQIELEGWNDIGEQMAVLTPGTLITLNAHLAFAADAATSGGSGGRGGLRVIVDSLWLVDPETVPAGTITAPLLPPSPPPPAAAPPQPPPQPPAAAAPAARGASRGGSPRASTQSGGQQLQRLTPPDRDLAAAFCAPGGSFVELAARFGVLPTTVLSKLLAVARDYHMFDWSKLAHEVEQFTTDGAASVADVAAFVDGWIAANPGAVNMDGSPKKTLLRSALLADPRVGPALMAAEATARAVAGGGRGDKGTYALINMCLQARAAGVRLY